MTTEIARLESEHGEHASDREDGLGTLATSAFAGPRGLRRGDRGWTLGGLSGAGLHPAGGARPGRTTGPVPAVPVEWQRGIGHGPAAGQGAESSPAPEPGPRARGPARRGLRRRKLITPRRMRPACWSP